MIDLTASVAVREWLTSGASLEFAVVSDSMRPALRTGDSIRVSHVSANALRVGDIVLVDVGTCYVVHRLVMRYPCWRTRGDAVVGLDAPVQPQQILGRVSAVGRGGEWRALPRFPWTLPTLADARLRLFATRAICALRHRVLVLIAARRRRAGS